MGPRSRPARGPQNKGTKLTRLSAAPLPRTGVPPHARAGRDRTRPPLRSSSPVLRLHLARRWPGHSGPLVTTRVVSDNLAAPAPPQLSGGLPAAVGRRVPCRRSFRREGRERWDNLGVPRRINRAGRRDRICARQPRCNLSLHRWTDNPSVPSLVCFAQEETLAVFVRWASWGDAMTTSGVSGIGFDIAWAAW